MLNDYFYNNIGINSISIISTLKENNKKLELTKVFLIMPLISHNELLNYLSNNINIHSLDNLIVNKNSCFVNFNKRFYQSIIKTINAIQYLIDVEIIKLEKNKIVLLKEITYDKRMGRRAEKIYKASKNISNILNESNEKLYLNLRVEV